MILGVDGGVDCHDLSGCFDILGVDARICPEPLVHGVVALREPIVRVERQRNKLTSPGLWLFWGCEIDRVGER